MSSKGSEATKRLYRKRIASGLCGTCGKPLDRDGSMCQECCDKKREYAKENFLWYKEHGICPICGKVKLRGDEKHCPECLAKKAKATAKSRGVVGSQKRAEYNARHRDLSRQKLQGLRDGGICYYCRKRKADDGMKTCSICRAKIRERKRIKTGYYAKPLKGKRSDYGLCTFCNEPPKPGYRVCEKHYELYSKIGTGENAVKAREEMKKQGVFNIYLGRNYNGRNNERMS